MEMFEVGGCVRDEILGIPSKDIDFTVVLSESDMFDVNNFSAYRGDPFAYMAARLAREGYDIKVETPEFLTVRAIFPKGHKYKGGADFVLSRKEAGYSDGRRPDEVQVGTLEDDLARRDFTMNAIAKDAQGNLIDPFDGQRDIERGIIRAVGDARTRIIEEDALRGMRALRFSVTKGFDIDSEVVAVLLSAEFRDALSKISKDRVRDELEKMFQKSTLASIALLQEAGLLGVIFHNTGLRLMPTMKG